MTGFEVDPTYWEAAIKSFAPTFTKKAIDDIQLVWGKLLD
jgi:hypothetical protein